MSALVRRSSCVFTTVQLITVVRSMPTASFFNAPMFEYHFSPAQNTDLLSEYVRHSRSSDIQEVQPKHENVQDTVLDVPSDEHIVHAARHHHHARRSLLSAMSQGFEGLENKSRRARSIPSIGDENKRGMATDAKLKTAKESVLNIHHDEPETARFNDSNFQDASKFFGMGAW